MADEESQPLTQDSAHGDSQPSGTEDASEHQQSSGGTATKHIASSLPLVAPTTLPSNCVLVQTSHKEVDLEGDVGAVGRLNVGKPPGAKKGKEVGASMLLDLKGYMFAGDVVPSNSIAVVALNNKEAKIEAICHEYVQLSDLGNIFETEELVDGSGTLDALFAHEVDDDEGSTAGSQPGAGGSSSGGAKRASATKSTSAPKKKRLA